MRLYRNGVEVKEYTPIYSGKRLVIAIDSSKSNSAMFVADDRFNILDDYEINGAGSDTDVYDLCKETRHQLTNLFMGATVVFVGIEDIITKKEYKGKDGFESKYNPRKETGMDIHQSRAKITAVFNNFMFWFEDHCYVRPIPINNWEWKTDILPANFRTRDHDKGSKDYLLSIGNPYGMRKDDVTDAYCILAHIKNKFSIKPVETIIGKSSKEYSYNWGLYPESMEVRDSTVFDVGTDLAIEDITNAMAGKLRIDGYGELIYPVSKIPIDVLYTKLYRGVKTPYAKGLEYLKIVVRRH